MKNFLFLFFVLASTLRAEDPDQLYFEYRENLEPFSTYSCSHKKANVGLFEWDVDCLVRGVVKKYFAHVVLSFYPKTIFGVNSYEFLYWVTDTADQHHYKHSSSSVWIHNSSIENKMNVIDLSQGVENDNASLRLAYVLKR